MQTHQKVTVFRNLGKQSIRFLPVLLLAVSSFAQAPRLFFTDLTSGPTTGGETSGGFSGAYVTLYGNYLGSSQGSSTVTLNGSSCLRVVSWGTSWLWYQKIVVQLGSSCSTGNFSVTTSAGTSNAVSFSVAAGHIYFVSLSGSDSNPGSFSLPWATIAKAGNTMVAGDIAYVENGVTANSDDGFGSPFAVGASSGTASQPIALVTYPGASATIGGSNTTRGIINYVSSGTPGSYWVIAGFSIQNISGSGTGEAIHVYQGATSWRIVGNSITCPVAGDLTGCVTSDGSPTTRFYGNEIHNVGASGATKTYHAFYWGDDSTGTLNNDQDIGWNSVHDVIGCRGIMFHSQDSLSGREAYNFQVHDNLVYNTQCDGIALANVNATKGAILVYNNLMYHVGTGPDNGANYSCVYVGDSNGNPTTPVSVYNNTCYDAGSVGLSQGDAGAWSPFCKMQLQNNITYELAGEGYTSTEITNNDMANFSGSNNLWFGLGNGFTQTTANVNADPLFVNAAGSNFQIQSASPARDAGVTIGSLATDYLGVLRPQGSTYDMGAYEYFSGVSVSAGSSIGGKTAASGSILIH